MCSDYHILYSHIHKPCKCLCIVIYSLQRVDQSKKVWTGHQASRGLTQTQTCIHNLSISFTPHGQLRTAK